LGMGQIIVVVFFFLFLVAMGTTWKVLARKL
jgi:hypothetical protein